MLLYEWCFVAVASFLGFLIHGFPTVISASVNRINELSVQPLRRLQDSSVVAGCRWAQNRCLASGTYYSQTGAFEEFDELLDALRECSADTSGSCGASTCKTIDTDEGATCVNMDSQMDAADATRLTDLLEANGSVEVFRDTCPLTESLDGIASLECKSGWEVLIQATGCESCREDVEFFTGELTSTCAQLGQGDCESASGTQIAARAICNRAEGGAAENSDGAIKACADSAASEDSSGLSTGAVAGIAIAAIVATIAVAALIAWAILRAPRSRSSKKRAAAAGAVPHAPGTDPSAPGMQHGAPYGAHPGMPPHQQPPVAYGYGQQPPQGVQAGQPGAGGAPAGIPRMVPTDMYPSAEQFMQAGQEPAPYAGSAGGGGSFYGGAYAGSAYGAPAGSGYGGSAFGGPEEQQPSQMRNFPGDVAGDIARLPARDVLVKQVANSGDPAHMFSIGTRAAWDATAAGTMPSPTTTDTSKPEEVLEAQLDYIAHQLSGTLLEDSRVGAWVFAAGLQQRISSRTAVVFVHGRNEPEAANAASPATAGQQLRALKFYFLKEDFDRNVAASQVAELKDVMPVVERIEGDPYQLNIASLPSPLNMHALPPLIINERGETLDEHVARTQPNFVAALSIMIHLAQVIERLHSVGWVHRDLKPSNCLFLAQPARWALIDWACAAKTGALVDVSFSLYYAPPETVNAYRTVQGQMQAHPSADVWSLGVMAWELFTGRKFYGPAPDLQYVVNVLGGGQPLPSEQELPPDIKKRLGNSMFRATFLSMLHRDPQQRPSMRQLLTSWESFFSQTRPN